MTDTGTIWSTTALSEAGPVDDTDTAEAVNARANVMAMTEQAEAAVLAPRETGSWSHDLRAALAARMARHFGQEGLAQRYAARAGDSPYADLADPANAGTSADLEAVVSFVDQVAVRPRDVTAADIERLHAAGISDADIVRLAELNAFIAYQARLVAGLRLLGGANP